MSSGISTEPVRVEPQAAPAPGPRSRAEPLHPWQLFTLAGLVGATIVVSMSRGRPAAALILLSLMIFAAALVGLAALRTLGPLVGFGVGAAPPALTRRARAAIERDKALALRAIKELEFDRAMGKVSQEDFEEMSGRLRARAARLIRQVDAGLSYRDEIEREITRRVEAAGLGAMERRAVGATSIAAPGSPDGAGRGVEVRAAARACAGCGTQNDQDARFCKHCGAGLGLLDEA
jgi:hypothetical protein